MKYVQFIDGAENCAYDIFAFEDDEFTIIFPGYKQDIEFIEDVVERIGDKAAGLIIQSTSKRPVKKTEAQGIHGTVFFSLLKKKKYYPRKRESDLDALSRGIDPRLDED